MFRSGQAFLLSAGVLALASGTVIALGEMGLVSLALLLAAGALGYLGFKRQREFR
jgi:hypothetical protein